MKLGNILQSQRRQYIVALMVVLFISTVSALFLFNDIEGFDLSRREVLLRRIGHEVLLHSGDSTSRVLPLKKISDSEYQIGFEREFAFQTDFLVNTTQRLLSIDPIVQDYVVNVLKCGSSDVLYGFAISKNKKNEIISCIGRKQPIACYSINIKFQQKDISTTRRTLIFGSMSFLAFVGFFFWRKNKPRGSESNVDSSSVFILGRIIFDASKRQLLIEGTNIELTKTETRLLVIFASSPNETIARSRLQKEIWEDEGVIVGRSLDMFISKLRKKLELDPNIQIVVVRGTGYRLEVRE